MNSAAFAPSFWPALAAEGQRAKPSASSGDLSGGDCVSDSPSGVDAPARPPGSTGEAGAFAYYAPSSAAQLQELSAFLATAPTAASHVPPTSAAMSATLLDELLLGGGDDLGDHIAAARGPMEAHHGDDSDEDELMDAGAHGRESGPLPPSPATARLLQLEDNYERKKKRAKINRKDLNARFHELMDLLHLREDRKLNRAKVLEKAIEHIEKLTAELASARAQLSGNASQASAPSTNVQSVKPAPLPLAVPRRPLPRPAASSAHPWTAPSTANGLPLASMLWVPMVAPSSQLLPPPAAVATTSTRTRRTSLKRSRDEPNDDKRATSIRSELVSETKQPAVSASTLGWIAHHIPAVLEFCDAWTLASVMGTSRELERAARSESLWALLCQKRWWIANSPAAVRAQDQWAVWHVANRMPNCFFMTVHGRILMATYLLGVLTVSCVMCWQPEGLHFATGRSRNISVWGLLSQRSNGYTTRTVLVSGKTTVMQVVELYVVVQNMGQTRVRITDRVHVTAATESSDTSCDRFLPLTADSGAHLTPHVVAINDNRRTLDGVAGVQLLHGDMCVLRVFLRCDGLELEAEFLQWYVAM